MRKVISHHIRMLQSHCDEIIANAFLLFKKNQVRRVRISEMIIVSRNLVIKF